MSRKNVYLGIRVPDVGEKGLDSLSEVEGIAEAILEDYELGIIDRATAARRINLLKLIVMRDDDFKGAKRQKAIKIVDEARNKFKNMSKKGEKSNRRSSRKSSRSSSRSSIGLFEELWEL